MYIYLHCFSKCLQFGYRERKKRIEKPRRFSRSHSRSPSPPPFRGRNTAMDAQEALARRSEIVMILMKCNIKISCCCLNTFILMHLFLGWKEQRNCKNRERRKWLKNRSNRKWLQVTYEYYIKYWRITWVEDNAALCAECSLSFLWLIVKLVHPRMTSRNRK